MTDMRTESGATMDGQDVLRTVVRPLKPELIAMLRHVPILSSLREEELDCLEGAQEIAVKDGEFLIHQGDPARHFFILLQGMLHFSQRSADGRELPLPAPPEGTAFGEVPLLANMAAPVTAVSSGTSHLLRLTEEQFWGLMTSCPGVRRAILGNMAERLQKMQGVALQQEKMAALGVMAAGLMHELNNPGSAARRAASQLRGNLERMHTLAARFTKRELSTDQKECMLELQTHAMSVHQTLRMNSLEQSDAEERLAEWMEEAHVDRAWQIAPTLVSVGIHETELVCARSFFPNDLFSDALSWLEAMVSSQQLVATIEESIGRVSDLVHAVKSYAYEGKGQKQTIDVNDSIHATMVILAHKLREKEIVLNKSFGAGLPLLETDCSGLNQVWTNLLDNAIDAVPHGGRIAVQTWAEEMGSGAEARTELCVSVTDNGSGIPLEVQPHIFDPFYTTKPVGVGTGLGLGIVYRIVEQYGGTIHFTSQPGNTEFVVRIPKTRIRA